MQIMARMPLFMRGKSGVGLCLLLGASLAQASSYALAGASPSGIVCSGAVAVGGSGAVSADTGLVPCGYVTGLGYVLNSSSSASGSWVTGDFATSAQAAAAGGGSIQAAGTDTFVVAGYLSLPSGMTSGSVTLGLTGLSGTATGLTGPANPGSSSNEISLTLIVGGSGGTSATSVACLNYLAFLSACPGGGFGLGFGPGSLPPITLPVSSYEYVEIDVSLESAAYDSAVSNGSTTGTAYTSAEMTVDPLYLLVPAGATFDSGIADFLSGPAAPTAATPEPASWLLLVVGLLGAGVVHRAFR